MGRNAMHKSSKRASKSALRLCSKEMEEYCSRKHSSEAHDVSAAVW